MPVIGTFKVDKNGYLGSIRTLTLNAKVRILANDRKSYPGAPDFRLFHGATELGAAWRKARPSTGECYLSVKLDDPALPRPIWGALVDKGEDGIARLLWSRHRPDASTSER